MKNAKKELLQRVGASGIVCAKLRFDGIDIIITSKQAECKEEYESFLSKLDKEYDSGYGDQILFGIVILSDGTWLEREDHDGLEWWSMKETPKKF